MQILTTPQPAVREEKKDVEPMLFLTDTAKAVLAKRYLKCDEAGNVIETPIDMFRRVADNIASADLQYGNSADYVRKRADQYMAMMVNMEFLAGMTLRNAGRKLQQLSACYVLPMKDSMEDIYTTLKHAAFLHKTGAGIGYDFSSLRPRDDMVSSTGGKSCGPVGFMKLVDFSCQTIVYNAATRRPGNMGILRVDHPDILEFITAKLEKNELNNFNISVAATTEFMEAVKAGIEYDLVNPRTGETVKKMDARKMFGIIAEKAWTSAEPGLIFIDEVNKYNPTPHVGRMEATNQCGEQPLLPYEACNLGSINLSKMLRANVASPYAPGKAGFETDWGKLEQTTRDAVRFLDDTIDVNNYPLEELEKMNKGNRKIGVGVMGWADMLVLLGIPYDTDEAVAFGEKVMRFIQEIGHDESQKLGQDRGNFLNFIGSRYEQEGSHFMRNATVTTIAPTGTTAIIANCSSGIEPIFALAFVRREILDKDAEFIEVNSLFEKAMKDAWAYKKDVMQEVAENGTCQNVRGVPEVLQRIFRISYDIVPEWHVKHQAAFQKWTDNAVSKTVNMQHHATVQDVWDVYMQAYDKRCKGITIYRDGSRDAQVLSVPAKKSYV